MLVQFAYTTASNRSDYTKNKKGGDFHRFFLIGCASEQIRLNNALSIAKEHGFVAEVFSEKLYLSDKTRIS